MHNDYEKRVSEWLIIIITSSWLAQQFLTGAEHKSKRRNPRSLRNMWRASAHLQCMHHITLAWFSCSSGHPFFETSDMNSGERLSFSNSCTMWKKYKACDNKQSKVYTKLLTKSQRTVWSTLSMWSVYKPPFWYRTPINVSLFINHSTLAEYKIFTGVS